MCSCCLYLCSVVFVVVVVVVVVPVLSLLRLLWAFCGCYHGLRGAFSSFFTSIETFLLPIYAYFVVVHLDHLWNVLTNNCFC